MVKKQNKIILLLLSLLLFSVAGSVKLLLAKMERSITDNGKNGVEAVAEQIQQTYELQVENFYSRLRVIDAYAAQENTEILENAEISNFLAAWENETEATLFFIDENGTAMTIDEKESRLEISSALLMDLKENQNIAKLISVRGANLAEAGFLMAVPCREYQVDGETYIAIGALIARSNLDSVLKLYAYSGEACLFVLDGGGEVVYTNMQDEKLFQNYSLLKHLVRDNAITDGQRAFLEKEFEAQKQGTELLGGERAFYLSYRPIAGSNATLVCIVPKKTVDTMLTAYQSTVFQLMIVTASVIIALCAGLSFSMAKISSAEQKANMERQNRELQQQNINKMMQLNNELKQAQSAAKEAMQSAVVANKAKTEFLSNMSHDIRTPMNAIVGITALIEHDAGNEAKVREYAEKIEASSQNLLGIINDVLDMGKIESGKTTLAYTEFSMHALIRDIDAVFRPQTEAKHQTFETKTENLRHEWLIGDDIRLMQIFSNLLSNAVKYTQEGGKIQFCIEESSSSSSAYARFRFRVKDNGMGMDPAFQDRIFDAFTREDSSQVNKIQGTGLGMAITRNLIELMGGSIDVDSAKGQGSCFEVLLDLKTAKDSAALPEPPALDEAQDAELLRGMKFLCAEDNELNAEILKELLKMEGAECTVCENGELILNAFLQSKAGDYDAILMDVQMPVMNGYEAAKAIRASGHELAKTMPIIAMTANAFSEDVQASLAAGMNAHVSKPVEIKALVKTIKTVKLQMEQPV